MAPRALPDCPASPNCVSSRAAESDTEHYAPPITLTGSPQAAHDAVVEVLHSWPRTRIVTDEPDYLHAVVTTRLLRFRDDVEVVIDAAAGRIDYRSASRVGYSDLGVNRRRMETFVAEVARRLAG